MKVPIKFREILRRVERRYEKNFIKIWQRFGKYLMKLILVNIWRNVQEILSKLGKFDVKHNDEKISSNFLESMFLSNIWKYFEKLGKCFKSLTEIFELIWKYTANRFDKLWKFKKYLKKFFLIFEALKQIIEKLWKFLVYRLCAINFYPESVAWHITIWQTYKVHIVVVTKKPPMCRTMCLSLYCMNGLIQGRCIN